MGYLSSFFAAALLPMALLLGMSTYLGRVQGDLTRLGDLAERDFGRRAPAGAPPLPLHRADELTPQVVVLGDSFSHWNVWQSQWMSGRARHDVLTFIWDGMGGSACLIDWAASIKARYPTARYLVVQTVERSLGLRLSKVGAPCEMKAETTLPVATKDGAIPDAPDKLWWPLPDPVYVASAWAVQHRAFAQRSLHGDKVMVTPLARRDLFTHRRNDLMLSYRDDDNKRNWPVDKLNQSLARWRAMQDSLQAQGIQMVMLVVPDKSTAYAPYALRPDEVPRAAADAWELLSKAGLRQVAMKRQVQAALPATVDLYLPNDTHLGPAGYRLVAAAVRDELSR